ncbi:integrase, catalytic region, zinc finger, CCHC-type containing protein [Tanacetum coccineum]
MMSDSDGGDLSDVNDFDDLDMIMRQVQSEQQQEEAERVRHRNYIYRERLDAEARLMADYFGPHPKYPENYFRKRYHMSRTIFLKIVSGFSVIMKCTCAIRQLAYGVTPDSLDEYLQMGNHCARDCLDFFTMCVIDLFMPEYLRKPDFNDIQSYTLHTIIFMVFWECLKALIVCTGNGEIAQKHGMANLLEVAGANNDLTVLNNSPLFDDILDDIAPVAPFECNGVTFEKGYYLADDIYPQWSSFVKSFTVANSEKNALFKQKQESARKDVKRAFGVLQGPYVNGVILAMAVRRMPYEHFAEFLEEKSGNYFQETFGGLNLYLDHLDMDLSEYLSQAITNEMDACVFNKIGPPKKRYCNDFSMDEMVDSAEMEVEQNDKGKEKVSQDATQVVEVRRSTVESDSESEYDSDDDSDYQSNKSVDYLSPSEEELI